MTNQQNVTILQYINNVLEENMLSLHIRMLSKGMDSEMKGYLICLGKPDMPKERLYKILWVHNQLNVRSDGIKELAEENVDVDDMNKKEVLVDYYQLLESLGMNQ